MGHGGTLDPLAEGVLIVGIGRGTKHLQQYLACTKTYETVVTFGASTDSYDCTGEVVDMSDSSQVTRQLVKEKLAQFRGTIKQAPPVYSALKINGIKACEYIRQGKELPRALEAREMHVEECELLEWIDKHDPSAMGTSQNEKLNGPSARIKLIVSSGFYVRSFAHDLGIACGTFSHMTFLRRTRQATFTTSDPPPSSDLTKALTYADLDAGEEVWSAKLRPQLEAWIGANPVATGHVDGRDGNNKRKTVEAKIERPKQRFRGGWVADTKKERIKQQGGKWKGKWGKKKENDDVPTLTETTMTTNGDMDDS